MQGAIFSDVFFDGARRRTRAERIARIDALATLLESALVVPGTNIRFGLDSVIGLVPGIGDVITTLLALYIVREAHALGAPKLVLARMILNVAVDGGFGVIPVVGDLFDATFRANRRNIALLRKHLASAPRWS